MEKRETVIKFETFIKEEYREPTPTEKSFRKWANLPPANPMVKFYYVRVFNGGRCIDEDKNEVTIDFVFVPKNCPKKMRVTFDYNEITNRINCKKTTL